MRALARRDITKPFPVQQLVVRDALAGHDLLVQSPTGSGKTLAFGIPLVERIEPGAGHTSALVLAPTRELGEPDRRRAALRRRRPRAEDRRRLRRRRLRPAEHRPRGAPTSSSPPPGRLEDLIARGVVSLGRGPHPRPRRGRPDARHGLQARRQPDRRPDPAQAPDAVLLGDAGGGDRQDRRRLHPRRPPPHPGRRARAPRPTSSTASSTSTPRAPSSTTWSSSCATASAAARWSSSAPSAAPTGSPSASAAREVEAVAMHGDKSQRQRERALARFERGDVDALIATDVAARGIDVDGVTHVINFDAPGDRDSYVHRVGRTGRAGRRGPGSASCSPTRPTRSAAWPAPSASPASSTTAARPGAQSRPGSKPASTSASNRHPRGAAPPRTAATVSAGSPQVDLRRCGVSVGRRRRQPAPLPESWGAAPRATSASLAGASGPPRRRRPRHRRECTRERQRQAAPRRR